MNVTACCSMSGSHFKSHSLISARNCKLRTHCRTGRLQCKHETLCVKRNLQAMLDIVTRAMSPASRSKYCGGSSSESFSRSSSSSSGSRSGRSSGRDFSLGVASLAIAGRVAQPAVAAVVARRAHGDQQHGSRSVVRRRPRACFANLIKQAFDLNTSAPVSRKPRHSWLVLFSSFD